MRCATRHVIHPVRIPHSEVIPTIRDGILTVVTRDQRRQLPIARLYCYEEAAQLGSRVERELRMEAADFTTEQLAMWQRLRQVINGFAWDDFQKRLRS